MFLFKKGDDLAVDIGTWYTDIMIYWYTVHKKEKKVQAGDATNG